MTKVHYEVQHYTLVDGWVNCWTDICVLDDSETPAVFKTYDEAKANIDDLFETQDWEIKEGIMPEDARHDESHYRIAHVIDGAVKETFPYIGTRENEKRQMTW